VSVPEAILLGLIQGLTEFLPVSSSGHLVMGQVLLGIEIPGVAFEIGVHVATLVSILVVYRERVGGLIKGAARLEAGSWRYLGLLALATIPAAALGFLGRDSLERLFEAPEAVGVALLATGTFLWTSRTALAKSLEGRPGIWVALLMGLAQAFAMVPGISRSGATVVTGLWLGVDVREAAAFSFLMAVPAILGAAVLDLPALADGGAVIGWPALTAGSIVAGITGVLAIRTFVRLLERRSFYRFAPYCWGVGGLFLLYLLLVR
jgi:undecaprenyl-diphosphatase